MHQYLVCYSSGAALADNVHDMLGRYTGDDGTLQAVWVVREDGSVEPVDVTDHQNGEYEAEAASVHEYVQYDEEGAVVEHQVTVDGEETVVVTSYGPDEDDEDDYEEAG